MHELTGIGFALLLAFLVENLVEYLVGPLLDWIGNQTGFGFGRRYVAAGVGVALCVAYGLDILGGFGFQCGSPLIGLVISGLVIGRGSNFMHDLIAFVGALGKK